MLLLQFQLISSQLEEKLITLLQCINLDFLSILTFTLLVTAITVIPTILLASKAWNTVKTTGKLVGAGAAAKAGSDMLD